MHESMNGWRALIVLPADEQHRTVNPVKIISAVPRLQVPGEREFIRPPHHAISLSHVVKAVLNKIGHGMQAHDMPTIELPHGLKILGLVRGASGFVLGDCFQGTGRQGLQKCR